MRALTLYTLLSLDGIAEEPGNWMFEADEEVFRNLASIIAAQDDVLLGRGTYDYWSDYWPTSTSRPSPTSSTRPPSTSSPPGR